MTQDATYKSCAQTVFQPLSTGSRRRDNFSDEEKHTGGQSEET